MAERRRRAADDPPTDAMVAATEQAERQSAAEREKYGERLNTVVGQPCPTCGRRQRMTVHPGHRLYQLCKHAFELPPLPQQRLFSDRRRSGKPKGKGASPR